MGSFWFLLSISLILMDYVAGENGYRHHRSISDECPVQENIPKCSCMQYGRGIKVVCSRLATDEDLQNHLKTLQDYKMEQLSIMNYNASSISTTLWKELHVETLLFEKVEVSDASFRRGQSHFQGLENSLETLHISKSFKNGHRPLLNLKLDHLEKLQHVVLEHNEIPEVGNDWFSSGPKKLTTLIFEGNGIEELGDRAFSSLSSLKLLAIAGNHLRTITREMLPSPADVLAHMDLSYNKIRALPNDIFTGMPSLDEVSLENNLIHMIPKDTWVPVSSQLQTLRLGGNVLQCDKDMQWICGTKLKGAYGKCGAPIENKGLTLQQFCKS